MSYLVLNRAFSLRFLSKLGAASVSCMLLSWGSSASAAPYAKAGNFSISVERLFGVYINHEWVDRRDPIPDDEYDRTAIGFLYQSQDSGFAIPRIAFDYFLIDNLSIGAALGYYQFTSTSRPIESQSGYMFAPRVGYNFSFTQQFGVQPHAGITYIHGTERTRTTSNDFDTSQFALSVDGMFYFMPVQNVGFTGTVIMDLGVTGSQHEYNGTSSDRIERMFGLTFGMFAHF